MYSMIQNRFCLTAKRPLLKAKPLAGTATSKKPKKSASKTLTQKFEQNDIDIFSSKQSEVIQITDIIEEEEEEDVSEKIDEKDLQEFNDLSYSELLDLFKQEKEIYQGNIKMVAEIIYNRIAFV